MNEAQLNEPRMISKEEGGLSTALDKNAAAKASTAEEPTNYDLGVIVAMDVELETIRAALEDAREEHVGTLLFYTGTYRGVRLAAARSGVGKVFAAMCAQTMILRYHPQRILGAGIAGALAGLPIGGCAIADRLAEHDMDLTAVGYPAGYMPGLGIAALPSDEAMVQGLIAAAREKQVPYAVGTIASGDTFVALQEKKDWLRESFGAIACEMEGAAIAKVCYANEVPFAVIRCISDNGDENAQDDYPAHEAMAAHTSGKMVLAFAETFAGQA